jgi:hypothetical protein
MAVDWTGTGSLHACCWRPGARAAERCGPFRTSTLMPFWPALTLSASGTTSGCARRGTTRHTPRRNNIGTRGGARGFRAAVPLQDVYRRNRLRLVRWH